MKAPQQLFFRHAGRRLKIIGGDIYPMNFCLRLQPPVERNLASAKRACTIKHDFRRFAALTSYAIFHMYSFSQLLQALRRESEYADNTDQASNLLAQCCRDRSSLFNHTRVLLRHGFHFQHSVIDMLNS